MDRSNLPRRSVFAVWHWPRWTWCACLPVIGMVYILLPLPSLYFRVKIDPPDIVCDAERFVMSLAWGIRDHIPILDAIDELEDDVLVRLFGPWNLPPAEY